MDVVGIVALGAGLGFLIGLTGVGGGALVAPALFVLLDTSFTQAVGMSLVYSIFAKIAGFAQHVRQGSVRPRLILVYGLPGAVGSVIGSRLLLGAADAERAIALVMAAVLAVVAGLLIAETNIPRLASRTRPLDPRRLAAPHVAGLGGFALVVGVFVGLTSVGSGSLVIVSMALLLRMAASEIVGSNIAIALVMVIPAGLTHILGGTVDPGVLVLLILGSIPGTVLGSRATLILPDRWLRSAIALLVAGSAVATVVKAY